jgi:ketosteroid isomerase-like protein
MMKFMLLSVSLAITSSLVGCSDSTIDLEAEGIELMQLSRDWSAMVGAGNFEDALNVWADDAVMLPPDLPVLAGKSAISEYVAGAASIPGFKISWEPKKAYVSSSGDMAYLIEQNLIEMEGENGEVTATHGKVVTIWRRDAEGKWKNVVDMWNTMPTPAD